YRFSGLARCLPGDWKARTPTPAARPKARTIANRRLATRCRLAFGRNRAFGCPGLRRRSAAGLGRTKPRHRASAAVPAPIAQAEHLSLRSAFLAALFRGAGIARGALRSGCALGRSRRRMLRTRRIEMRRPATAAPTSPAMRHAVRAGRDPRGHGGAGVRRAGLVSTGWRPAMIRWRKRLVARRAFFGRGVG